FGDGAGRLYRWYPEIKAGHFLVSQHAVSVEDIQFSPDGEFMASSSLDNTSIVRRMVTDQLLFTIPGRVIRFANDSRRFALADNRGVSVQELRGERAYAFYRVPADSVQFSPDGDWLVTGSFQGPRFLSTNGF